MICVISKKAETEDGRTGRLGRLVPSRVQTKGQTMLQEKPDPGHARNRLQPTEVMTVEAILKT